MLQTLVTEGFLSSSRQVGLQLMDGLEALSRELGLGEVRGHGLLLALELGADIAPQVVTAAREAGLLLNAPRSHCLRFMPALNSTEDEIRQGLALLRDVLKPFVH